MALPDPGERAMASDWRISPEPLARFSCLTCGLGARRPSADGGAALFRSGYVLYAHPPGEPRERARQEDYARWIAGHVRRPPRRVLDVGCGNGSLLSALRVHWPDAELVGCDLSAESVAAGSGGGIRLWQGGANDLPAGLHADLVVSVNVVEHTADPRAFIAGLAGALAPDGMVVVVCPDGRVPGVELLFADHLFSFIPAHLQRLLAAAGLAVTAFDTGPAALGEFQMAVARHGAGREDGFEGAEALASMREGYLQRWRALDRALSGRLAGSAVCFGAGEAAGLLRAYAPSAWSRVRACTFDGASAGTFGEVPIVPLENVRVEDTLLVGVRPRDQRSLSDRLQGRFARVVTWYDLVDEQPGW